MKHYFGRISGGHMIYNPIGMIAKECWCEIPKYFLWIRLEEFVIMPNHIHGIIVFNKDENPRRDAINRVSTGGVTGNDNPMRKNNLARIIRWYKGRTSFEIHKIAKSFRWQPRYYEHIIRSIQSFRQIQGYIATNPQNWHTDHLNECANNYL
ncbi:MAG: transposase [Sedimentisphaeraceae bacterium JB056]